MTKKARRWLNPIIGVPIILVLAFVVLGTLNLLENNIVSADENNTHYQSLPDRYRY